MRKLILGIGLCLLVCLQLFSQSVVKESLQFRSEKMGKDVRYSIYLPDGYDVSDRKYPVLYLLHGWTDDETSWLQMGNMQRITMMRLSRALPFRWLSSCPMREKAGMSIHTTGKSLTRICFSRS